MEQNRQRLREANREWPPQSGPLQHWSLMTSRPEILSQQPRRSACVRHRLRRGGTPPPSCPIPTPSRTTRQVKEVAPVQVPVVDVSTLPTGPGR